MTATENSDTGSAFGGSWIGTDQAHSARMYDYFLGGKTNYPPDRTAAEEALKVWPAARIAARANRAFMHRATRAIAELGIRQFLDIGTGIPTSPNLHQVAQQVTPEARVVYADNDPIVLTHARALLSGTAQGRTAFVEGDITNPGEILSAAKLTETLDLTEPVALSTNALFHFVPDDQDPRGILARLLEALPPGSALCLSHVTADIDPDSVNELVSTYHAQGLPGQARTRAEIEGFFTGLDLLDPGIVLAHRWQANISALRGQRRPDIEEVPDAAVSLWAGVGFKT